MSGVRWVMETEIWVALIGLAGVAITAVIGWLAQRGKASRVEVEEVFNFLLDDRDEIRVELEDMKKRFRLCKVKLDRTMRLLRENGYRVS